MNQNTSATTNASTHEKIGKVTYFSGYNTTSFIAALNFALTIKKEIITVTNVHGIDVGYAVHN